MLNSLRRKLLQFPFNTRSNGTYLKTILFSFGGGKFNLRKRKNEGKWVVIM